MSLGYRPEIGDILAALDVLVDVQDISDSITPEEGVEYRIAVEKLVAEGRKTLDLLNMELVKILDGQPEVVRDGFRYYIGAKTIKERHDHQRIRQHVVNTVLRHEEEVDADTYRLLDRDEAVRLAVHLMSDLYVNDSAKAKVGQLDRLQIPRDEVIDKQRGENEVKKVPA